jgi:methionyl-tRNA formyltransferase
VYSRRSIPIKPDDTTGSLTIKLAELGATLLLNTLPGLASGGLTAVPQPVEGVSYAKLLAKTDGVLDFTQPAITLARQVRAFDPWPGTYTFLKDSRIGVVIAEATRAVAGGEQGEVLEASSKGVLVRCGDGGLWLSRVKPAGRAAMPAASWVAGRGVQAGDRFT